MSYEQRLVRLNCRHGEFLVRLQPILRPICRGFRRWEELLGRNGWALAGTQVRRTFRIIDANNGRVSDVDAVALGQARLDPAEQFRDPQMMDPVPPVDLV